MRDVDRDALLALGAQAVGQQREVRARRRGARRRRLDVRELVGQQRPGVVEQPADQGRLAVVDRAGRGDAQEVDRSEVALPLAVLHRGLADRSSARVSPRSVTSVAAISATTSSSVAASSARRRCSPCRRPCGSGRSSGTAASPSQRSPTARPRRACRRAEHLALVGEVDRRQLEPLGGDVLPDVELGPVRERERRAGARPAGCGRCRGPTARAAGAAGPSRRSRRAARPCAPWPASAPRRAARRRTARRSAAPRSRRAAPCVCSRLRDARPRSRARARRRSRPAPRRRPAARRPPPRGGRGTRAPRGSCGPVATCSSGNGKRPGAERLLGQPQQHDRVLAAAEQQRRALALGGDLADDVDRLGLESSRWLAGA